jgi:pyruvate kinase
MRRITTRLTAIVATLGPATADEETLRLMIEAGMDVARLNFAHGDHDSHGAMLGRLRAAADACGAYVAVLQDLPGPKLRLRTAGGEGVAAAPGGRLRLVRRLGDDARPGDLAVTFPSVLDDLREGEPVLFGDGAVRTHVAGREGDAVVLQADEAGTLAPGMGVNLPQTDVRLALPTDEDWKGLAWGVANGVDYVGLSYVRSAEEVRRVKEYLAGEGSEARVIAKIEKPQAVEAIDAIMAEADGILVARGDLGVEVDLARVPVIQKDLIRRSAAAGVPVITATQMLQSMIAEPHPTRAEVSDVAGAVFDGSDAVMLSGETAIGRHPVRAVRTMDHIIDVSEDWAGRVGWSTSTARLGRYAWSERAIVAGAAGIAADLDVRLIVALTHTGATALLISKQDLRVPILAVSDSEATCRRMALYRGVVPVHRPELIRHEDLVPAVEAMALDRKLVVPGDRILIMSGYLPGRPGGTDTLRVHTVSESEQGKAP